MDVQGWKKKIYHFLHGNILIIMTKNKPRICKIYSSVCRQVFVTYCIMLLVI